MYGYFQAFEEILEQEKEMGLTFDAICVTDGSGGTYAGFMPQMNTTKAKRRLLVLTSMIKMQTEEKGLGILSGRKWNLLNSAKRYPWSRCVLRMTM